MILSHHNKCLSTFSVFRPKQISHAFGAFFASSTVLPAENYQLSYYSALITRSFSLLTQAVWEAEICEQAGVSVGPGEEERD